MAALGLVVFDLDFTLWDCGGVWVDCTEPPFSRDVAGVVRDAADRRIHLYEDVPEILDLLDERGIPVALASRTEQPPWAREVLALLGIRDRFAFEEIYPSSKVRHFEALRRRSGVAFEEMLFFDDETRNIVEVGRLGVTCIEVASGLGWRCFDAGVNRFS